MTTIETTTEEAFDIIEADIKLSAQRLPNRTAQHVEAVIIGLISLCGFSLMLSITGQLFL